MTQFQTYADSYQGKQGEIATALEISQPYLSLLLAGKKKPSLDLAVRIERWSGGAVPTASWVDPARSVSLQCQRRMEQS